MKNPTGLHDDTITRRINYEGFPFQRAVYNKILETRVFKEKESRWKAREEASINVMKHPNPDQTNSIDILAWGELKDKFLYLLIECKKADPLRKIWIFANDTEASKNKKERYGLETWTIYYPYPHNGPKETNYDPEICLSEPFSHTIFPMEIVDNNKNKAQETANSSPPKQSKKILDACLQASSATIGKLEEVEPKLDFFSDNLEHFCFIPIVVTTANIFSFECRPTSDTLSTGELPSENIDLKLEKWLLYSYPLPFFLYKETDNIEDAKNEIIKKLSVLIVNSNHISELLNDIVDAN